MLYGTEDFILELNLEIFSVLFYTSISIAIFSLFIAISVFFSNKLQRFVKLKHFIVLLIINIVVVAIAQLVVDADANIRVDLLFNSLAFVLQIFSILLFMISLGFKKK